MSRLDAEALHDEVERLTSGADAAHARFGLAVSGGVDSMALMLLAHRAFPGRIMAASVDHGIRVEARTECRHVATVAATLDVPHETLTLDQVPRSQAEARSARYERLHRWAIVNRCDWLLTAHHADDQLETMIMRLNRSSGVSGLAGIRARVGRKLLRPLLPFRRAELESVVAAAGITAVDDPSNRDRRYDRVRLRTAMAGQDFIDPVAAARSAAHLAEAEAAVDWSLRELEKQRVYGIDGGQVIVIEDLPLLYCHRLIARVINRTGGKTTRGERVAAALRRTCSGEKVAIGDCTMEMAGSTPLSLLIRRAPPRAVNPAD